MTDAEAELVGRQIDELREALWELLAGRKAIVAAVACSYVASHIAAGHRSELMSAACREAAATGAHDGILTARQLDFLRMDAPPPGTRMH